MFLCSSQLCLCFLGARTRASIDLCMLGCCPTVGSAVGDKDFSVLWREKKALKFLLQVHERDARVPVTLRSCKDETLKGSCGSLTAAGQKGESLRIPCPALLHGPAPSALYPRAEHVRHTCQNPSKLSHDISFLVLKSCLYSLLVPDSAKGNEQLCWFTCKLVFVQATPTASGEEGLGNPLMDTSLPKGCLPGLDAPWLK